MSSITEEQLLDLSAETTAMIASYAAIVVVVKGTKPSARVELYSVKVNALITAYRAEVVAREKAESEREELRKVITELVELYPALGRAIFSDDWDGEAGALEDIVQSARALLARLKDGRV